MVCLILTNPKSQFVGKSFIPIFYAVVRKYTVSGYPSNLRDTQLAETKMGAP